MDYFTTCEQIKAENQSCSFSQYCDKIEEIIKLQKIFSFFIGPFPLEVENAPNSIQLELVNFQNDSILKDK